MISRFNSFVIFGAMRTGSNYLEASLNEVEGIRSFGEVFNPQFIGRKDQTELLGVTMTSREADPIMLLRRLRTETDGLSGFRFFEGHDPRVFEAVMGDSDCAKIVLSRDLLDSFVSLKIANETGQWMLRSDRNRKMAKVRFDPDEFDMFRSRTNAFYRSIRRSLQTSGQTAFEIAYDDLSEVDVLNGLVAWLGVSGRLKRPSRTLLRQNPVALADKLSNPEDVPNAGIDSDAVSKGSGAEAEPARQAAVPTYIAAAKAPLIFLPVRCGPVPEVEAWMAALDNVGPDALTRGFTRKSLAKWRALHPLRRSFTVLRHPIARAHEAFSRFILATGPETYAAIRAKLLSDYRVAVPSGAPDETYGLQQHRAAFLAFLKFLKLNLQGRTSIRVDGVWASQDAVVQGFGKVQVPDMVIREERIEEGLAQICAQIELEALPLLEFEAEPAPFALGDIYDEEIERAGRAAYGRDYAAFGFADWRPIKRP